MKEKAICISCKGKRALHEDNFVFNHRNIPVEVLDKLEEKDLLYLVKDNNNPLCLYAISDGMGGHKAGNIASRICTEYLLSLEENFNSFNSVQDILEAIQKTINEINLEVVRESNSNSEYDGMAATVLILFNVSNKFYFFSLGDSRAYYFNNEKLEQLTTDNNEGQRLRDTGLFEESVIESIPTKDRITKYIGYGEEGFITKADENFYEFSDGLIILCSDGIYDYIEENSIIEILNSEDSLFEKAKLIVSKCTSNENSDNATLMLIPVGRS